MKNSEGILLLDKPLGRTSFFCVHKVRKRLGVQRVGHAGTLDPLATGLLVLLVGRRYTKMAAQFLEHDKVYRATLCLGIETNTYDREGEPKEVSSEPPTEEQLQLALKQFQGETLQTPPMYAAKKLQGKRLYELARAGIEVERAPVLVRMEIELESYHYPHLELMVRCSKGTYIRSLAHDFGRAVGCGAHLAGLVRMASGPFSLEQAISYEQLEQLPAEELPLMREELKKEALKEQVPEEEATE